METPTVNITGGVTINVIPAAQPPKTAPSIPITPFVKTTFMNVDNDLLLFNSFVSDVTKRLGENTNSELADIIGLRNEKLAQYANSDYNTELVTVFAAEIAAASFLLYKRYGGEPALRNG